MQQLNFDILLAISDDHPTFFAALASSKSCTVIPLIHDKTAGTKLIIIP